MFDFDAGKLLIIGVVALIVIGPKELPRVLRQVGQTIGRLKRMASEFQGQFMDAMKEADIQSIKDEVAKMSASSSLDMHFDPARDIQSELTKSIESTPTLAATPATAEALPAATDGFSLPSPDLAMVSDEPSPAAAGAVPTTDATPIDVSVPIAHDHVSADDVAGDQAIRKRKIVLPKRRGPGLRLHDVSDRTGFQKGRVVRLGRQEATER